MLFIYIYLLSAYGKVFLVCSKNVKDHGKLFAMKVLKKSVIVAKAKTTEHTITERSVLEAVRRCPFIITMHYAFQTDAKLHIIMGMYRNVCFLAVVFLLICLCWAFVHQQQQCTLLWNLVSLTFFRLCKWGRAVHSFV